MDWLLNEEEINAVVTSVQRLKLCDDPYMSAEFAAKAQARKLVECLEENRATQTLYCVYAGNYCVIIPENIWYILKKEVG